jgi:hypothetical protein
MLNNAKQFLDEDDEAFLLSFAADVKAFLEPIIHEQSPLDQLVLFHCPSARITQEAVSLRA